MWTYHVCNYKREEDCVNKVGGPGGERIISLGIFYNTLIQDNIFDILGERDELDKKTI
jgi:hypothetical protein